MLWFTSKPNEEATRDSLMGYAERYFYKYQYELSSGTVKGRLGNLNITVSFTVTEDERSS